MEQFQLSNEAKGDLRSIAIFTEKRWGRAQRNLYIKQLDEAFLMLAQSPDLGISCDYIRNFHKAATLFSINAALQPIFLWCVFYIKAWIMIRAFDVMNLFKTIK
jgi:plasmid stabilization system protein ParE